MIEVQRHLQGQLVDRRFPLLQYLGGTDHSSVFLTEYEYSEGRSRKATIKLVEALPGYEEAQLIRWRLAAKFSHPNLLHIFEMDRCKIDGTPMLYVVMECAEEDLADTLLERPLTPSEAHDLFSAVLDVLGYIHSKGFVHGRIQPSNIMAIGDQVKLSSDGICRIDEMTEHRNGRTRYSAPEYAVSAPSTASDIWSLGATMVECLTGSLDKSGAAGHNGVTVPADLPAPFLEMARHCLAAEPQRRWDVAELKARLQKKITQERPGVPESRTAPQKAPAAPVQVQPKPTSATPKKPYPVALTIAGVAVAVVLVGMAFFHRSSSTNGPVSTNAATASSEVQPKTAPTVRPKRETARPTRAATKSVAKESVGEAAPPKIDTPRAVSTSGIVKGDVVHRVMPDVPHSASDTIWGTVRVGVRVSVDASGNVVGAKLDPEGPSRYFAKLSIAAAREWKFRPPSVDGATVASEWVIHFGYRKTESIATPVEQRP
ncbi:MAG TPA: protein kinase [Candidatus Acidoferrales bacterium]|nr:protein kinase [Candidatus Acidoferrales bacterium]